MRITNTMMTNNMLLSINGNKERLSLYEQQLSTGKKIQKPSDDPIVAVRALKFRTTVKEIEQYKSNAKDAISWASVTEQAVSNITDIMKRIRELSVQATSDVMNIENRKDAVVEIEQLTEQFMVESNVSFAGRYVFGGYRTNVPVVFNDGSSDVYELEESFESGDIETVKRVVNDEIIEANRMRLGYDELAGPLDMTQLTSLAAFSSVNTLDATDANAYTPALGQVNFLKDTGELIFHPDNIGDIPADFTLEYSKDNFAKGDLVPQHYFTGRNTTTGEDFTFAKQEMLYQVSYSQEVAVNTQGYEMISVDLSRDISELVNTTVNIAADSSLTSELQEDLLGDLFGELLTKADSHIDSLLKTRASIGGKISRLDLTINRLEEDNLNFTDLLSKNEDIDFAEVMVKMASQEAVYNASLQTSAKVLQPTLLDFIR